MSNKQVILYFLEQCWYQTLLYWFLVTLDGIKYGEFDLFQPLAILFLLLATLIETMLVAKIEDKKNKRKN
ncbi:hypothetical protein [Bacillus mycoides]|uniref:hypothetical protein n=1 Tax=Bacillus mycoides TaxID=1405 RepID=UPI000BF3D6B4|nr:hypothetical protein [Bacillus mycoides]PGA05652.1 hypothetical protein COL71_26005 [Bacillus mycoides]